MSYTIKQVREIAERRGITLREVGEYNNDLINEISENFTLSTNGVNLFAYSKKTKKKKPLPINNNSPHVFGNICVLNLTHFADFYMANYDLEAQKEQREQDKKYKAMADSEEFFCTGCGMWKPKREKKGYMWCGC